MFFSNFALAVPRSLFPWNSTAVLFDLIVIWSAIIDISFKTFSNADSLILILEFKLKLGIGVELSEDSTKCNLYSLLYPFWILTINVFSSDLEISILSFVLALLIIFTKSSQD